MNMPAIEGVIERRLLINYRVALNALAGILPAPFRPKLVNGYCALVMRRIPHTWHSLPALSYATVDAPAA